MKIGFWNVLVTIDARFAIQIKRIKMYGDYSGEVEIKREVRQECVMSPILFNFYKLQIFEEALTELRTF